MLNNVRKEELVRVCKFLGIKGISKLNKAELVERINSAVPDRVRQQTGVRSDLGSVRHATKRYTVQVALRHQVELLKKLEGTNKPASKAQIAHLELLEDCFVEVTPEMVKEYSASSYKASYLIYRSNKAILDGRLTHRPVHTGSVVKAPTGKQLKEIERLSSLVGVPTEKPLSLKEASLIIGKLRKKEWQLRQIALTKVAATKQDTTEELPGQVTIEEVVQEQKIEKTRKGIRAFLTSLLK